MKKIQEKSQKSNIILIILLIMTSFLFLDTNIIIIAIVEMINLFLSNVFPALFPFFVLSDLLMNYNFIYYLNKLLNKPFSFLFHINGNASFVVLMSLISGFPSGSKYTRNLLEEGFIDVDTANFLITFTHFSNPLFVFGTMAIFLNDWKLTLLLFVSHVLANFFIAFVIRPKKVHNSNILNKKRIPAPFVATLTNSIYSTFKILLLVIGNSIFVSMVSSVIVSKFDFPFVINALIHGLFDMTKGISAISFITIPKYVIALFILSFISFGGISVHLQASSILAGTNIKYRNFFFGRICQVGISILLFILFYHIFIL